MGLGLLNLLRELPQTTARDDTKDRGGGSEVDDLLLSIKGGGGSEVDDLLLGVEGSSSEVDDLLLSALAFTS